MWYPKEPGVICTMSTTPIMAMGWRQSLPLSVVQLTNKHCQKPNCRNGDVDIVPINPGSFGNLACLFPGCDQKIFFFLSKELYKLTNH